MGTPLFTIDADTRATITQALDDIITNFGKECLLIFPSRFVRCSNCLWDASTQRSTNRWRTGGPMRFNGGSCPMCKGDGQAAMSQTATIQMKVEWDTRKFIFPIPNVDLRIPYSVCETKFYVSDLPSVSQCDHMIVQLPIAGVITSKMKLASTPISPGNIIQGRYAIASWEAKG